MKIRGLRLKTTTKKKRLKESIRSEALHTHVFVRVAPYMDTVKKINAFSKSKFIDCCLVPMCHNFKNNNDKQTS